MNKYTKLKKNAIDRLQKQQEIEEKDVYMQRQAVLKEIETVRNREAELRLRIEAFEKTCKIQEDKTKTMEELLRRRELAVKTMEDTYDQKLKNELSRYQLELNEEYTKRTEKLTENEKRNKVETIRMQKESAAIDAKLEEHSRACAELRRLQMELDTSQSQYSLLTQQNELLRERLETMNDYPTLRRERVEQQAQLRLLKKQLEEAQEENQRLRADLGRPSVEQLALQTELRRLESARRLSEEEFDSHRQVLQAQLHNEVERCAQLKAQLIDCEERTQWMTTHAEDIKMQLRQTQLALENEVLRNPKPSLVDRSVLELSPDKLVPPDIYVDRGVLRAWVAGYDDVCEAGVMPSRGRSSSPDSDTELVAGAKARIRELEKEAETLEEAYRNYQQRAVHATVSHMLPPRCLLPQRAPVSPRPHSTQRQHISHQRPRSPQRQQVPPDPCPHSPQHPQVSHRPLSPQRQPPPQRARAPTSPQPRVTFAEDQSQDQYPGPGSGRDFQSLDFSEARFSGDRRPQEGSSSPPRRLSSTPLSLSRRQLHTEPVEEAEVSSVAFPVLSPQRQLSPLPLPRGEVACSGDFTSDLSPPRSPQLRSTARGQCSPPQVQQIIFSSSESESSPQPEKITIEDLTEPLPEPSHIPELLLDTAGTEEEALDGPLTVPPSRAPWDLTEAQLQGEVQQTLDEPARQEEEEELRWERERRAREEKRQREKEEAQERELRELERLEKERLLEEVQQYGEEEGGDEEKEERGGQEELKEAEEPEEEKAPSSDKDPLQKYLKMIMEQRQSPHVQSPAGREEPEHRSPEAESLSDEKDDSVAFSHEDADEFW